MRWSVLIPVGDVRASEEAVVRVAARPVRGKIAAIGFLSNGKPNASTVERELGRLIGEHGYDLDVHYYDKPNAALGATSDLLDRIVQECDAIVTGTAD